MEIILITTGFTLGILFFRYVLLPLYTRKLNNKIEETTKENEFLTSLFESQKNPNPLTIKGSGGGGGFEFESSLNRGSGI